MSAATNQPSPSGERIVCEALDRAFRSGVLVIAAAGNQGTLGGSAITRHPWVIPVVACDSRGFPLDYSNLGRSIGTFGLRAPGDGITSLGTDGKPTTMSGTSVATPFVTGAVALLWSIHPRTPASMIRSALRGHLSRPTVVPPLLDAWSAHELLSNNNHQGGTA